MNEIMSKINGPLFSMDAYGTIGKSLSYSKKKQNNIVSKYSKPGDVSPGESSPRQKDQRSIIRLITIHWQCMDDIDRLTWETAAKAARFKGSGYHYFLHLAQTDLLTYLGLAGYWSMNYETSGQIKDLSGNGNHGILSPVYPCDCPTLVDSFNKKLGKAALFNGISNYISLNNLPYLNSTELSFSLLYHKKSYLQHESIFSDWSSTPDKTLIVGHSWISDSIAFLVGTGSNYKYCRVDNIFFVDELAHWTFTFKGSTYIRIFKNSIMVGEQTVDIPATVNSSHGLTALMKYTDTLFSNAIVDDFIIYNKALEQNEINLLYKTLL